ncbi:MAG: monovalent cation/H+ antiporter complex subunit F [Devosia sp.]
MSAAAFLALATALALSLIGVALVLTLVRFVRGPTLADRVLCLDTITVLAASAIVTFAIRTGLYLYTDIAIALGLLGFLSTAAFARYLMSRSPGERQ